MRLGLASPRCLGSAAQPSRGTKDSRGHTLPVIDMDEAS